MRTTAGVGGGLVVLLVAWIVVEAVVEDVAAGGRPDTQTSTFAALLLSLLAVVFAAWSSVRTRRDLAVLRGVKLAARPAGSTAGQLVARSASAGPIAGALVRGATNSALDLLDFLSAAIAFVCGLAAAVSWPAADPDIGWVAAVLFGVVGGWAAARRAAASQLVDLRLLRVLRTPAARMAAVVGAVAGAAACWWAVGWSPAALVGWAAAGALAAVGVVGSWGEKAAGRRRAEWATQISAVTGISADLLLDPARPVDWSVDPRSWTVTISRPPAGVLTRSASGQLTQLVAQVMPDYEVGHCDPSRLVLTPASEQVRAARQVAGELDGLVVSLETLTELEG